MLGILLLIVFLCVMGFILALIHNMFSDDELEVKKAIIMLILTGIVGFVVKTAMAESDPSEAILARSVAEFLTLTLLLKLMAYVSFGKALLIALCYGVVSFLFGLLIVYMLSPA